MAIKNSENTISVFSLLGGLRRRWYIILIPAILVGAGFTWYAKQQPDRYRTQALIAAANLTPPSYLKEVAPEPLNIQDHLWTVREVLFSAPILEAAARQLPEYEKTEGPLSKEALDAFKSGIAVKVEGEHTFTVGFEGENPKQVAAVTQTLSEMFVDHASVKSQQTNQDTQSVIQQQIDAVNARLAEQDRQVRNYKQGAAHELPEHVDDNIRVVEEVRVQQETIQGKIGEDEARRVAIQKEMHELESQGALQDPEPVVEKTPVELRLQDLQFKLKEAQAQGKTAANPDVRALQKEVQETQKLVVNPPPRQRPQPTQTYLHYVQLKSELDGIAQRIVSYNRELESLANLIETYNHRVESAPAHERNLDAYTREMSVNEAQLRELLNKKLDTKLSEGLQKANSGIAFTIVEPATVPTAPYSPQRARMILMGICAGLGLGVVAAFILEQNDTSFGSVDDFQAFTTMPVIGVIPTIPGRAKSGHADKSAIVTLYDPDSVPAEQYRILGMKIHQACLQQNARVLMVTSSTGAEGKSMTAINMASALAGLVEGPVLLVDADMRRPRLHEYLEFPLSSGIGFHDLLLRPDDDIGQYLLRFENLHIIPGSAPTANPIAALASPKIRTLFDRLKQQFQFIVVDAPPTLPIADSHILSGLCDKVLFVVRSRKTPRELFQHAVESFDASNLIGAVLNDVEYQRSSYGYAYRYYRENYLARK